MTTGYFPLDLTDHTVRHGKPIPCRACNQPRRASFLTHGYCPTCWAEGERLWTLLDKLTERLRRLGRRKSPDAAQTRHYCKVMRKKYQAELKALGLPATRPDNSRAYGPGQAKWQRS